MLSPSGSYCRGNLVVKDAHPPTPQRSDLETWPLLRTARNHTKPQVRVGEWPPASGQMCIAKDVGAMPLWWRTLAGRPALRREWRALRVLRHVEGVPRIMARPDTNCLVETCVRGTSAFELGEVQMSEVVVERFESLVRAIHAQGVTHGDLHRDNILIDGDNEVALVDWATSCVWGRQPRGVRAYLRRECERLDWRAVAKFKLRHAPRTLTAHELDKLTNGGSPLYRSVKLVRRAIQRWRGKPTRDLVAQQVASLSARGSDE